jgi:hypothetical protein
MSIMGKFEALGPRFLGRAAVECGCRNRPQSVLLGALVLLMVALPLLDRFVPLFALVLPARVRVPGAFSVAIGAVWISCIVAFSKHEIKTPDMSSHAEVHYSYSATYRLFARGAIAAGLIGVCLAAVQIPDLFGRAVAFSGHIYVDGAPREGVKAEFLNSDRQALNKRPVFTGQDGLYVASLSGDRGRVAYCRMVLNGCVRELRLARPILSAIYGGQNAQTVDFNVDFDCPAPVGALAGGSSR